MRYPQIGKQPTRTVSVPQLSGGLNLRDSVSMVADNQLTESLNMWFKDGVLKTRPGLVSDNNFKHLTTFTGSSDCSMQTFPYIKKPNGDILAVVKTVSENKNYYYFMWVGGNGAVAAVSKKETYENFYGTIVDNGELQFIAEHRGALYVYMSNSTDGEYYIYTNKDIGDNWRLVTEEEYHIPTVAINMKPLGGGDMLEPYNLLSPYYKSVYSISDDDDGNMEFELLIPLHEKKAFWNSKKITAKIKYAVQGEVTHEIELGTNFEATESEYKTDGLMMGCNGTMLYFYQKSDNSQIYAKIKRENFTCEDITVIAPCPCEKKEKVFGMTRSIWFGGAAYGLNGGGRLFLCGNKSEPSLLQWSSLNNPLYFPENNYAYVGSASSKLCTFGKQDETLVLFKENETYYTYYVQNSDITADQLKNQSVIDYEASSVYFPIIQLNDSIGCDCPDTVQLCRNRLVWAHSNGKVYSLVTQSQYNERNIFEISEMIRPELRKLSGSLQNAISADWEGYYVLALGTKLYLMDYNSYGYQYIYSYSKAEDANVKTPWYIWEIEIHSDSKHPYIFGAGDMLGVLCGYSVNSGYHLAYCYFNSNSNSECDSTWRLNTIKIGDCEPGYLLVLEENFKKIPCHAQTKIFDFSAPNIRKNIKSVGLSVGNNGGTPINVKFITDCGTEEDVIVLDGADTKERTAGFLDSRILYPCIKSVLRFGVEFSCEGLMAIEGINLSYRYLGGAR